MMITFFSVGFFFSFQLINIFVGFILFCLKILLFVQFFIYSKTKSKWNKIL